MKLYICPFQSVGELSHTTSSYLHKGDDENVNIITLRSRDGTELYTSSDCSGYPAAMPMPVDDDETFVKNIDNDNDDNDLPTGGAATEKKSFWLHNKLKV